MLILTIRTDKPEAELGLFEKGVKLEYKIWQADRKLAETFHQTLKELLSSQQKSLKDLRGIVVFQGPGSFTGLRIGISVANALASSLNVPIIAAENPDWLKNGIQALSREKNNKIVLPEYGAPVKTTAPRK